MVNAMAHPPLSDAMIEEISRIFSTLGDVSRLKILRALLEAGEPISQSAIVERTGLSQANASKHLSHLAQVGLVTREAHGNTAHFSPVLPIVGQACELVSGFATERIKHAFQSLR